MITCGEFLCTGSGAYCCGNFGGQCCWYSWNSWWFWVLWLGLLMMLMCCGYGARRRYVRYYTQPRYIIVEPTQHLNNPNTAYGAIVPPVYTATGTAINNQVKPPAYSADLPPAYQATVATQQK